ncbi:hypothetical protein Tco_0509172 [Tanacetum coccineum]
MGVRMTLVAGGEDDVGDGCGEGDMVVLGGDGAGWWWWCSDGDDDGRSSGEGSWGDGGVRWEAGDGWPEVSMIRLGGAGKIREKKRARGLKM